MDYFLLKQDERYINTPVIIEIMKKIDRKNMNLENAHKLEDTMVFYMKCDKNANFLDILDSQLFLVSSRLKKIIEKYETDIVFKTMVLINRDEERQEVYYLPIFKEVEVLSSKSEFNLNKSVIKKLVLDGEKIKNNRIFKIKESEETMIVVRLDAAESILRRDFAGVKLERIEVM